MLSLALLCATPRISLVADRTAPIPTLLASVSKTKGCPYSGKAKTSAMTKHCRKCVKSFWQSSALCKKLDIRYRIFCVYFEFTHQESHLRNEPVSHCAYFEYPQPHHVRLEGFTKQCLRIPLCDTLHRIRCWVRTPILFMVY